MVVGSQFQRYMLLLFSLESPAREEASCYDRAEVRSRVSVTRIGDRTVL